MIIRSLCNGCFEPYVITLMPGDVELVKQIQNEKDPRFCKCPRLCGGLINLAGDESLAAMTKLIKKDPISITGKQLYQAVMGAGLPDEIPKDVLVLTSLLKANRVVGAMAEDIGGKFYLHELKLENGLTFHFSGGPRGAQILKVTKDREVPNGSASTG